MAIVSSGGLFDALRQLGLLNNEQITELLNVFHGRCCHARVVARYLVRRGWLTIYQVNQLLAGNGQHLVVGPYHVLDRLGQGGLSQVFKAIHTEHKWTVALKVLRPEAMSNSAGRKQFLQEMEAMALLDHPNVVQFCDVDQAGDTFYFAMEYIEGTDLSKLVNLIGPLPVEQACEYVLQAALGLQHAYEHNIIHRDIKPNNLFLTYQEPRRGGKRRRKSRDSFGIIKILDWGLAGVRLPRPEEQTPLEDVACGLIGTADYLSPEQARQAQTVDIRGDIYSLGCTFYFLLTGEPPFPDGTLMQKLMQHQQAEPASVELFREDLPVEVIALLKRMMAKKPEDRHQTPAAVALAIKPFTRVKDGQKPQMRVVPLHRRGAQRFVRLDTPLPGTLSEAQPASRPRPPRVSQTADTAHPGRNIFHRRL